MIFVQIANPGLSHKPMTAEAGGISSCQGERSYAEPVTLVGECTVEWEAI